MSNFSWPFSMDGALTVMALYVFIQYFLARAVLASISRQIPRYYDVGDGDGNLRVGMGTSMAIIEMLFDGDMPGDDFGQFVRIGLYVTRALFACCIPIGGFLIYSASQ